MAPLTGVAPNSSSIRNAVTSQQQVSNRESSQEELDESLVGITENLKSQEIQSAQNYNTNNNTG